jgi:hypothetical protein
MTPLTLSADRARVKEGAGGAETGAEARDGLRLHGELHGISLGRDRRHPGARQSRLNWFWNQWVAASSRSF